MSDRDNEHIAMNRPLVSIGMPVYNEESFIAESIATILAQDYENLEIIISDNGSTDTTAEICEKLVATDPRVRLHRYEANAGVNANFHYVFNHAGGTYFMWASGHDKWAPDMISRCVEELEKYPEASLAFATTGWIGRGGQDLGVRTGWTDTRGLGVSGRFMTVLWGNMNPILGVIRSDCMPDLSRSYTRAGADLTLLLELVLAGDFLHVPEARWWRRDIRDNEEYGDKLKRFAGKDFRINSSILSKLFPLIGLPFGIFRVLYRSRISWWSKLAISLMLLPVLPIRYITGKRANRS
jgi:glycosyltransferase involved in cell wall biosynthesis